MTFTNLEDADVACRQVYNSRSKPSDIAGFHSLSKFYFDILPRLCQDSGGGGTCRVSPRKPEPLSEQVCLPRRPLLPLKNKFSDFLVGSRDSRYILFSREIPAQCLR